MKTRAFLLILGLSGLLPAQNDNFTRLQDEWMGLRFRTSTVKLSTLSMESQVYAAGYEGKVGYGGTLRFYGGFTRTGVPSGDSLITDFKGDRALYLEGSWDQALAFLFVTAGTRWYKAVGTVKEDLGRVTNRYANSYMIWEFPVQAGVRIPIRWVTLELGVSQTYYYGKDDVKIQVVDGGKTVDFGSVNQTFIDHQNLLYRGNVRIKLTPDYTLGLEVETDAGATTIYSLTLYTPVKK
ncbi:MAG: hypothetical protein D6762_03300 [Candidatus Neomarinimicrobiota bacterium]|nr:MAG: hypothetical protein D6762_03300 [Candidatus Neomarinimicrobiota bacterium]